MMKYAVIAVLASIVLLGLAKLVQFTFVTQTQTCGGFAGEVGEAACPSGFSCKYPQTGMADQSGKCVLNLFK